MATVAINNAMNAGLLAVRILGAADPSLLVRMDGFMKKQEREVLGKVDVMKGVGWESYEVAKR